MTEAARLDAAQKQAASLGRITEVLIPLLLAAICLPLIGDLFLTLTEPRSDGLGNGQAALIKLIGYIPALCIAAAVIGLRGVLAEYAGGRFVSERASNAFNKAGLWTLAGIVLQAFVGAILVALLGGPDFAWRFDPFGIGMLAFATSMLMIGQALQAAAAALKAENDQIV